MRHAKSFVSGVDAVFGVAQQRPASGGQLHPDLVGPAGEKLAFQQRDAAPALQNLIPHRGFPSVFIAARSSANHPDGIFVAVLEQPVRKNCFLGGGDAVDQAQIVFLHLAQADFFIQNPQSLRRFGGHDDAAGIAVDAVAQSRREGLLLIRVPLPLLIEIGFDMVDQRIRSALVVFMDHHARPFVA